MKTIVINFLMALSFVVFGLLPVHSAAIGNGQGTVVQARLGDGQGTVVGPELALRGQGQGVVVLI